MVDVSGGSNNIKINVASKNNLKQIVVSPDALQHYTNLARGWANKLDSTVDGVEYSAKYYAQKAQASSEDSINAKNSILNNSGFIAVSADLIGDNNIGTCASNIETILSASSNAIAAQNYAQTAAAQAEIATTKAQEATAAVTDYADKNLSNITEAGVQVIKGNLAEVNEAVSQINTTLLTKLDTNHSNDTKPYVNQTYVNGASWYRVWSDGWKEQGGRVSFAANGTTVTFPKAFSNANYTLTLGFYSGNSTYFVIGASVSSYNATRFIANGWHQGGVSSRTGWWYACGK